MNFKYLLVILCLFMLLSSHYVDAKKKKKSHKNKVEETIKEQAKAETEGNLFAFEKNLSHFL